MTNVSKRPYYQLWMSIRRNARQAALKDGIDVYLPWVHFQSFERWAKKEWGAKPPGPHMSPRRLDTSIGFEPGNLKLVEFVPNPRT